MEYPSKENCYQYKLDAALAELEQCFRLIRISPSVIFCLLAISFVIGAILFGAELSLAQQQSLVIMQSCATGCAYCQLLMLKRRKARVNEIEAELKDMLNQLESESPSLWRIADKDLRGR